MRRFDEITVRLPVGDNDQTGLTRSSEPIIWSHPIWTIERLKRLPLEPDELGRLVSIRRWTGAPEFPSDLTSLKRKRNEF